MEALQHLWSSGRLPKLSSRICDSVILILCHLIRGEQIARDKLKEEKEAEQKKQSEASTSAGAGGTASASSSNMSVGEWKFVRFHQNNQSRRTLPRPNETCNRTF